MNPIVEHRYFLVRYIALYTLFAVGYAAVFAVMAGLPAGEWEEWWMAALDGAVFGIVSGFEGLILWNVLRYGTEGIRVPLLRVIFHLMVGILFTAVAVGAECLAMWAAMETLPEDFVKTIPARSLLVAAAYVCFVLWYSSAARSERERSQQDAWNRQSRPLDDTTAVAPAYVEPLERITVKGAGGKIEVIDIREITCLQAEGDYVAIVTASGRWLKEQTMKYFEETLPRGKFVRVHRSCIVSVDHISRIESSGRERAVVLRGGNGKSGGDHNSVIRISDAGYKLLRAALRL